MRNVVYRSLHGSSRSSAEYPVERSHDDFDNSRDDARVLWLWWLLRCNITGLWKELLQINEIQELEVFVHSVGCVAVLERKSDGFADTFHGWRSVVTYDIVHLSMSWKVHWKERKWRHVSVEQQHVLVKLHAIL